MSDDDLFDSDESGAEEVTQAPAPGSATDWEAEARKAFTERDKARLELRRTRIQTEYGTDIAELIPEALPPKEWQGYAEKLKALRGVKETEPTEQAEEAPPGQEEVSTEAEQNLAAVAKGPSGTAASSGMSDDDAMQLAINDPERYRKLRDSGAVALPKLPGHA